MNGGTYSEALKVGFDPSQAGMLARLSIETKSETMDLTREMIGERKKLNRNEFAIGLTYGAMGTFCVLALAALVAWGRV